MEWVSLSISDLNTLRGSCYVPLLQPRRSSLIVWIFGFFRQGGGENALFKIIFKWNTSRKIQWMWRGFQIRRLGSLGDSSEERDFQYLMPGWSQRMGSSCPTVSVPTPLHHNPGTAKAILAYLWDKRDHLSLSGPEFFTLSPVVE